MSGPILEAESVGVVIEKSAILDGVSFAVEAGEWLSIIGPNGAGKTTLLRAIGRLIRMDSGSVAIGGKGIGEYRQRELAKQVSYVPQAGGVMLPYTAFEFVLMARYPHLGPMSGVSYDDREAARQALEQTGTSAFAERALDTLSGGERQKVFVAAALAQGAPILLLDEPATFLDYHHQVEVLRLIRRLSRVEKKTVLCVTHDLNRGVYESDKVLALKRGRVAFSGSAEALFDPERLAAIYDTPFDLVRHERSGHALVVPIEGNVGEGTS